MGGKNWEFLFNEGKVLVMQDEVLEISWMASCLMANITVLCIYKLTLEVSLVFADGDCSHEIKRRLLIGRKVMTNLDSTLKSRDITLSTKVCLVKALVFQWSCVDVRVGL